ncbi:protein DpdJ [Mesorhizobium sp. BR1-1-15]|uniref:protein DpdJ n=1 Tax=Mesorhizobium sp. BR1-1-15 TaxID=2876654 RepID=UPI001CCEF217|nr:protein DpdJ [Mesorhizobium sp. BR1-1-15]MBZ9954289.1 DEAD/DEAH box helicase [Mesorhizobium sp. BR1-1-15]
MEADEALLLTALDKIEQLEARLLTWGLVDGHVSAGEMHGIIDALLDKPVLGAGVSFLDAGHVIAELISRALLFDIGEEPGTQYRSRMAEGVRLLFRLRQLFPQHRGPTGWQAAPTLVADFRFIWRRRRYPRREISAAAALATIAAATPDQAARAALSALVESFGPQFALAGFQVSAAARILSGLEGTQSIATLVSAGTGSGKTLAFYLPALSRVASHIQRDAAAGRWVKVLALYPRNELLKDQFAEVYSQARRLDATLASRGHRKILIGTFFGPTPHSAEKAHDARSGWRQTSAGLVCEYLRCPAPGCAGDMAWRDADRRASRERLECLECSARIESDEIILTRDRLRSEAPDILFTTTEMLNQRMGDDRFRHLFGIGDRAQRPVEMMLLDEVHTYAGISGAQVAFLLRRWRRLVRQHVSFVGLSATLRDGARFFAQLTGLYEQSSVEIAPANSDMIAEGAEYLLALRGDPVSRTALLSTTIQTGMLLSRLLDAPDERKSRGIIGERVFIFTDDIDVTNRMYFAMLDAEGRRSSGAPDLVNRPDGGLASLRRPLPIEQRKLHGQDWEAVVQIGHTLQPQDRKSVGRVMSMDPGVGNNLDIIVATASLEVGFNDPRVGAVIQHKAPRDVAQFLQRKGRAGRSRRMRPWTVAVLSDYGRDRLAYQGYDLLFDPELPLRTLPVGNRYVMRIQAVYATLDYLSQALDYQRQGSVWLDLSASTDSSYQRARQTALAGLINRILTIPAELDRYSAYLASALKIDESTVLPLLWDHPRPLMTQVLPTALRRLESNWRAWGQPGDDFQVFNSPLPEFAPANLFSDLNLPEVSIVLPQPGSVTPDKVGMPIAQALREFAPGRVSRRYGMSHAFERHWMCPPLDQNRVQVVPLEPFARLDRLSDGRIIVAGSVGQVPVYRPLVLEVQPPPGTVVDTSNARLRWRGQLVARESGLVLDPPRGGPWTPLIEDIRFYTHEGLSPIEVRRMALGSDAGIRFRDGRSLNKEFHFEVAGEAAALGFGLAVDAMCIRLRFPEALWSNLGDEADPRYRAMRTARFHHQAVYGPFLEAVDNPFARDWLAHLMLAALSNEAMAHRISLREAAGRLADGSAELDLDRTLSILFQSPIVDDANAQGNQQDKLRQDLAGFLADKEVVDSLFSLAAILWIPIDAGWEPWLRERYASTVGAAALSAITNLCPQIDADSLVLDVTAGPREQDDVLAGVPNGEIWISEMTPGGNGQIEEAQRQYVEDPRRFFSLMTAALRDNDFSLSDFQLSRFLAAVVEGDSDEPLPAATRAFRQASGAEESHASFTALRHTLADEGFVTFHAFLVALTNRILRPGSSIDSDAFFLDAVRLWNAEEERLSVDLDARVLAYRLARSDDIDAALGLAGIDAPTVNPDQWRFGVIYGLLWPRGAHIRQSGLRTYSPFADLPAPDPLLLQAYLAEDASLIDLEVDGWQDYCLDRLAEVGAATLMCRMSAAPLLADALSFLATNPVQTVYLSVFARVQAVRRVENVFHVDVDVAEALQ